MSAISTFSNLTRFLICIVLTIAASDSWAATTGRISGMVVDGDGAPLVGVGITVQGTRLGATSDASGRYFILQVPPGVRSVTAQLVGYRATTVRGVRISADLTTEVDFQLEEEAIEMSAVTVTAQRQDIDPDVTSSQIIIDAGSVAEMPVSKMLNLLSFEPGVGVNANNELNIRGGGPSEIQFQVDGMARTDPLTNKGQTQLNQVLVAEVTVLTGGFNAEYGNIRSGVVNAVLRDGSEGSAWPNIQGAVTYAPAQRKHFGVGAYDEEQYDYQIMSSMSPYGDATQAVNNFKEIYWPYLYEETKNHDATLADLELQPAKYRAITSFTGWDETIYRNNNRGFNYTTLETIGSYNKNDWTSAELREVWEYEANMNEQAWQYAHKPDINADLAASWALPNQLGGFIFGYSYNRVMTPVPARIPYARDVAYDAKLTLTPMDGLKMAVQYHHLESISTGGGSRYSASSNPELSESDVTAAGSDPVSLRSFSDLAGSLNRSPLSANKLNLSHNSPLESEFEQIGGSFTYTFTPNAYLAGYFGWSETSYLADRDLPRVDLSDWDGIFKPNFSWSAQGWMNDAYDWTDLDGDNKQDPPVSMQDALDPERIVYRSNYDSHVRAEVPTEAIFVTKEFTNILDADGSPLQVVSPQGYIMASYTDVGGVYTIGGGGDVRFDGNASGMQSKIDLTYAIDDHTFKTGVEFTSSELEYHYEWVQGIMATVENAEYRDYGGNWPTPRPTYLGFFVQDKYESQGMIANLGIRVERFNAGQDAYGYNDFFNDEVFSNTHGTSIYNYLRDAIYGGEENPEPWEIIASDMMPRTESKVYWRVAPRFGISHPVSATTKFFFNFGQFYSRQKSAVLYGLVNADTRFGKKGGRTVQLPNPNLRPARTTAYEAGVEYLLPWQILVTLRGYAKFNSDQVSTLQVQPGGGYIYNTYRNMDFEDIRGLELKISRTSGRFINGWFTYERSRTQGGRIGYEKVVPLEQDIEPFVPWSRDARPNGSFQAALILSTPRDWGTLRGGWSLTLVQDYRSGSEVYYNPDPSSIPLRELPEENWFPSVDYWNTDLKLSKTVDLPGGRFVALSFDIQNLWNTKRLNGSWLGSTEYLRFIYEQRKEYARRVKNGESTEGVHNYSYGDPDTFYILTRPWQYVPDDDVAYKAPLSPQEEWLHHLYPRSYRFGMRFSL